MWMLDSLVLLITTALLAVTTVRLPTPVNWVVGALIILVVLSFNTKLAGLSGFTLVQLAWSVVVVAGLSAYRANLREKRSRAKR